MKIKKDKKETGSVDSALRNPALKWIILAAVAVVAVIAAVVIVFITRSVSDKTNFQVVESDMTKYIQLAAKLNGGDTGMEKRTYGDASEALASFVNEYNQANANELNYTLSYVDGESVARGKADPWGNKYFVTAKKTSSQNDVSTYSFYIVTAGKDGRFNTTTLVLGEDDIYEVLLRGVAVNITNPADEEDGNKDTDFGIGDIIADKEDDPQPTETPVISDEDLLPTRVTITFNNQGGNGGPSSERIKNGSPMTSLSFEIPQKENYIFKGYFTEGDGQGICYYDEKGVGIGTAAFEEDITLFAHWAGAQIALMFDNEGGSGYSSTNATYGSKLPNVSVPTKNGYTFMGYYSRPNGEGERYYNSNGVASTLCEFTDTTTLYAFWSAQSYTVEHYIMETNVTYPASPAYSEQKANRGNNEINLSGLIDSTLIVENGIVFDRATVDGVQTAFAVIDSNDTVVRLYYKRCQYDVKLSCDGDYAELSGAGKYYYGAKVVINATVDEGYAWTGWFDLSNEQVVSRETRYTFTMPANPMSFEGRTDNDTFTIYLDANGGICNSLTIDVVYGESYYNKLPVAVKEGSTFLGWGLSTKDKEPIARSVKYTEKGDITLYAIWESTKYTISFDHQGGQGGTRTVTVTYGSTLPSLQYLPTREGYELIGYFTNTNGTIYYPGFGYLPGYSNGGTQYYNGEGVGITTFDLTSDITLYARWEGKPYRISYYDQGGGAFSGTHARNTPTEGVYGSSVTLTTPSKAGYIFGGWYTTSDCWGTAVTYAYQADPDDTTLELYAKWVPMTYTIRYRDQGDVDFTGKHGNKYPTGVSINSTVTLVNPTREGYSFGGWYSDKNCTTAVTTVSATIHDYGTAFTVYAKWVPLTDTITYYDEGGAAFSGTHGTDAPTNIGYKKTVQLVAPTRNGYDFAGWYSDSACTRQITEVAYTGSAVSVYAKWTGKTSDISYFDFDNASFSGIHGLNAPTTVTAGTPTQLVAPTKDGYDFVGWFSDAACTQQITEVTYVDGGVSVYVKWSQKVYTIAYYDKDGAAFSGVHGENAPATVSYGATVDLVAPTREGYDFLGWHTDASCLTSTTSVTGSGTETIINVYALWGPQSNLEN